MLEGLITGLDGRSRTSDLLIPNQALYQLSYTQIRCSAHAGTLTNLVWVAVAVGLSFET